MNAPFTKRAISSLALINFFEHPEQLQRQRNVTLGKTGIVAALLQSRITRHKDK